MCDDYVLNSHLPIAELVRFDEHENASVNTVAVASKSGGSAGLAAASRSAVYDAVFPAISTHDPGGWMYLNLNNGGSQRYSASRAGFGKGLTRGTAWPRNVSQNWVTVNLYAEDRYGVTFDAAWLGNGCSPAVPLTNTAVAGNAKNRIGPVPNINP